MDAAGGAGAVPGILVDMEQGPAAQHDPARPASTRARITAAVRDDAGGRGTAPPVPAPGAADEPPPRLPAEEGLEPVRRLVLRAKGRPLGEARVVLELHVDDTGTRVVMTEEPVSGPGRWLHNPASEALLVKRNTESLSRLAAISERRTRPGD